MNHASRTVRFTFRNALDALPSLFGIWLISLGIAQSACTAVGEQPLPELFAEAADAHEAARPKTRAIFPSPQVGVLTVEQYGNQDLLRDSNPSLNEVWDALAKVTRAQLSLTIEQGAEEISLSQRQYIPYVKFAFHWGTGLTGPFGESGVIPDSVSMDYCDAVGPDTEDVGEQIFAIDGRRFLEALRALSTVEFDGSFARNAVDAVLGVAKNEPEWLDDDAYGHMARLFYATVAPAFSDEIRADVEQHFRRGGGVIGTAGYALAKGYADLRRWAVRRGLLRPEATLIMTASVVTAIVSQSLDLLPDLWVIVGQFLCAY